MIRDILGGIQVGNFLALNGISIVGMQPSIRALAYHRVTQTLLTLGAVLAFQVSAVGHCVGPASPCERLEHDMVVFIGKPVSVTQERYWAVTVTFDIQELLWGPPGLRSIRVLLDDSYGNKPREPEFFAVNPLQDGRFLVNDCVGLNYPVAHPFVDEFRRAVAARRAASIVVKAQWHGYVPVSGTEVHLSGKGGEFHGSIDDDAGWTIPALPPGKYRVTATRPHFQQNEPKVEATIPPMSCADLRILMENDSEVTGQVVDARGEPIRNATFHLSGQGGLLPERRFSLTSLRDAFFRRLGWIQDSGPQYKLYNRARTDGDGKFAFRDVYPGWYYLSSDISELNENFKIPLPKTYYPGVYGWPEAKHLVVEEGKSIREVLFRLPDFGSKRRVVIRVLSEDDAPVAGAIVEDSGLDPGNEAATNSGVRQATDRSGQVALDLWAVSGYRFRATLWGTSRSWSGGPLEILPGQSNLQESVVLKGLRLKRAR